MSESTAPPGSGQGPTGGGDGPRVSYEYSYREGHRALGGEQPAPAPHSLQAGHAPSAYESPRGAGRKVASWILALPLFALPMLVAYWRYSGSGAEESYAMGRAGGFGFLILFVAALVAASLRKTGRNVALPLVLSVLSLAGIGLQYVLREHDKAELKAAVENCLTGGTQPFTLNSPRLAAMPMTPAQEAVWAGMTQGWEPPAGSPLQAEDFVMRPVVFQNSVPAVALAVPGAGEEQYRDEMLPAFDQLPGAGTPIRADVAGREGYAATFQAGAALITTNGCWGVMVVGRDIASVRAIAPELVSPATTPGRPVAASRS